MKDWGWFILLAIGCLVSAIILVFIIEILKGLPFFKDNEVNSALIINSKETVIDENIVSPSTSKTNSIFSLSEHTNHPSQQSNNLIANPSFESNPLTSSTRWQTTKLGGQQVIEWSTEQAATGQHALKISANQAYIGWPGWLTQINHQANSSYRLQAKYYTADGANAWLELAFLDSNNGLIKSFSSGCPRISIKNQWQLVERLVKAEWIPEGSHRVRIGLRQCLNHTKGKLTTLYFDDVSLLYTLN